MKKSALLMTNLASYLQKADSKTKMIAALESLLTKSELAKVSRRLEIAQLLREGKTQREIANLLGVGIGTVTRGSREIKSGGFSNECD